MRVRQWQREAFSLGGFSCTRSAYLTEYATASLKIRLRGFFSPSWRWLSLATTKMGET
jgi:hypothetical protein